MIFLVGEAKGEHEARINSSFVGPTGAELLKLLNAAECLRLTPADYTSLSAFYNRGDPTYIEAIWQRHPQVFRTNVFQLHPPGNDLKHFCGPKASAIPGYPALEKSSYVRSEFIPELDRLASEVMGLNPNCIICLGNTALWAFTGTTKISDARGYTRISSHTAIGWKLLATYHPTSIFHQYSFRPIVIADLIKARQQSRFPGLERPERSIWIEPTLEDVRGFFQLWCRDCEMLSVDIETYGSRVTCIGFSPRPDLALVIPFEPGPDGRRSYWADADVEAAVWHEISEVLTDPKIKKVFQNGLYDIAFLWRSMHIPVMGAAEDTMLLHHALQPEMQKGLGFLGSLYSDERQWKQMRKFDTTIKRDD